MTRPLIFRPGSLERGELHRSQALGYDAGADRDLHLTVFATSHRVRLAHDTVAATITLDLGLELADNLGAELQRAVAAARPTEPAPPCDGQEPTPVQVLVTLREVLRIARHGIDQTRLTDRERQVLRAARSVAWPAGNPN